MNNPALSELLASSPRIIAEFAIAERLRRTPGVELHPTLFNTPLIYGPADALKSMTDIYIGYVTAVQEAQLPMLLTAPTWRLDSERVADGKVPETINTDAVKYLIKIRDNLKPTSPVLVGALVGPKNDCYRPDLAPDEKEAEQFHRPQIQELGNTAADYLQAQTLPSINEAIGISKVMAETDKPYIISFCTGKDGKVLDGTPLPKAMADIDSTVTNPPVGYYVNCTHPNFLLNNYTPGTLERLIGIQANASSKDVSILDGAESPQADPLAEWADSILRLQEEHQLPVLGGCCGTDLSHLKAIL